MSREAALPSPPPLPRRDLISDPEDDHIELVGRKKDMEARLGDRFGMPARPEIMLIRDPRLQSVVSIDGPEVRPSSGR